MAILVIILIAIIVLLIIGLGWNTFLSGVTGGFDKVATNLPPPDQIINRTQNAADAFFNGTR